MFFTLGAFLQHILLMFGEACRALSFRWSVMTGGEPFYTPQVFVVKNQNFEKQLWRFVNGSFATVFNDVRFKEH